MLYQSACNILGVSSVATPIAFLELNIVRANDRFQDLKDGYNAALLLKNKYHPDKISQALHYICFTLPGVKDTKKREEDNQAYINGLEDLVEEYKKSMQNGHAAKKSKNAAPFKFISQDSFVAFLGRLRNPARREALCDELKKGSPSKKTVYEATHFYLDPESNLSEIGISNEYTFINRLRCRQSLQGQITSDLFWGTERQKSAESKQPGSNSSTFQRIIPGQDDWEFAKLKENLRRLIQPQSQPRIDMAPFSCKDILCISGKWLHTIKDITKHYPRRSAELTHKDIAYLTNLEIKIRYDTMCLNRTRIEARNQL